VGGALATLATQSNLVVTFGVKYNAKFRTSDMHSA